MSVFCGEIPITQDDEPKILPPMREIVMPDVLPSLLGLDIDVHIFELKKSPVSSDTHGGWWKNIGINIYATIPHREVSVWCQEVDSIVLNIYPLYGKIGSMQIFR